jgi:Ca2+-binding RTX toxin-like protein
LLATSRLTEGAVWSVTIASPLRDGPHALTATVSVDGLTSAASTPVAVTVVTGPPEVALTGITPDGGLLPDDRVVTTGAVTLEGTATPGCSLDLFEGTTLLGHVTASLEGTWSITPATLGVGVHAFAARATDAAGNMTTVQATVTVQPPPTLISQHLAVTVEEGNTLDLAPMLLANGAGVSLTLVSATSASQGALAFDAARQRLVYQVPGADPAHLSEAISYTLRDSQGSVVSGTIVITTSGPAMPTKTSSEAGTTIFSSGSGSRLIAGAAGQTLVAGGGNLFFARADTTVLAGGKGNRIVTQSGDHTIVAGEGNNTLVLADGNNTVIASGRGNRITGGTGDTLITGPSGNSTVTLGDGDHTIVLTGGKNAISVGRGHTIIYGLRGSHTVVAAGDGNNQITLGGAGNRITTGAGDDVITSNGGNAVIDAGAGQDVIRFAGTGGTVSGGSGNDALYDTGARHRIVLNPAGQGTDDIYGPVMSNGDVFDLRPALAATAWTGAAAELGNYLRLSEVGTDILVAIAPSKGAPASVVAMLHGVSLPTLEEFAAHALLGPN